MPSAAYAAGTYTIKSQGTADATTFIDDTPNFWGRGIRVTTDVTVHNGGSLVVTIKAQTANGVLTTLLASAAIAGSNQTNVLLVFPSATVTTNVSANAFLPKDWQITVAVSAATTTFSVSIDILS